VELLLSRLVPVSVALVSVVLLMLVRALKELLVVPAVLVGEVDAEDVVLVLLAVDERTPLLPSVTAAGRCCSIT